MTRPRKQTLEERIAALPAKLRKRPPRPYRYVQRPQSCLACDGTGLIRPNPLKFPRYVFVCNACGGTGQTWRKRRSKQEETPADVTPNPRS